MSPWKLEHKIEFNIILKHTDWDYFNYLLENNINLSVQIKTVDQLERELNAFRTAIQDAAWYTCYQKKAKRS
jgi:hypothetical protein